MKFEEIYIGQRIKVQYIRPTHNALEYGIVVGKDKKTHKISVNRTNAPYWWIGPREFYCWRLIDNDPPLLKLAKALDDCRKGYRP